MPLYLLNDRVYMMHAYDHVQLDSSDLVEHLHLHFYRTNKLGKL